MGSVPLQLLDVGPISAFEAMHMAAILVAVYNEIATAARALLQEYPSLKVRLSRVQGALFNLTMT